MLFCSNFNISNAQTVQIEGVEEIGILYKEVYHAGFTIHSAGWGINYRRGKNITGSSYRLLDFSYGSMRHPKEIKTFNPFFQNSNGYVFGKQNTFNILRTGIGKHKEINSKGDIGGFAVSYSFFGGISWGIEKPIYLEILNLDAGIIDPDFRTEKYDPEKHYADNIYGRAPLLRGIEETKIIPGLYSAFNFNFEFGKSQQRLKMIETGVCLDLFYREIPIMAFNENQRFFLTFHIRFIIGKRWNK